MIDGKEIAAELFRRTNKALTITGYTLDTIRELADIDGVIDWAIVWAERRRAAAAETAAKVAAPTNGLNSNGCKYSIDEIEQIVRAGAPAGANRSDVFHSIVGHYVGCGWSVEQILEHLQQFPEGIGGRYLAEHRLHQEIARSAGKYAQRALPLFNGNGALGQWPGSESTATKDFRGSRQRSQSLIRLNWIKKILSSARMSKTTKTRTLSIQPMTMWTHRHRM